MSNPAILRRALMNKNEKRGIVKREKLSGRGKKGRFTGGRKVGR